MPVQGVEFLHIGNPAPASPDSDALTLLSYPCAGPGQVLRERAAEATEAEADAAKADWRRQDSGIIALPRPRRRHLN